MLRRRSRAGLIGGAILSVVVGLAAATGLAAGQEPVAEEALGDVEELVAISAMRTELGRVQFCLSVGRPVRRECPAENSFNWERAQIDHWYVAEPLRVGEVRVWLRGRRNREQQVEVALDVQRDRDLASIEFLPDRRFMPYYRATVGRWARSSTVAIPKTRPQREEPLPLGIELHRRAPQFVLQNLFDGQDQVRLSDFRGRTLVVVFWASWAPHSGELLTALNSMDVSDSDLSVVGINVYDQRERARARALQQRLSFVNAVDSGLQTAIDWRVDGLPDVYVIDAEGVFRAAVHGSAPLETIEAAIEQARSYESGRLP